METSLTCPSKSPLKTISSLSRSVTRSELTLSSMSSAITARFPTRRITDLVLKSLYRTESVTKVPSHSLMRSSMTPASKTLSTSEDLTSAWTTHLSLLPSRCTTDPTSTSYMPSAPWCAPGKLSTTLMSPLPQSPTLPTFRPQLAIPQLRTNSLSSRS